ncbi:phospholipase D-like domain-containing protein [Deltaproteobacteria bacterium TL4]
MNSKYWILGLAIFLLVGCSNVNDSDSSSPLESTPNATTNANLSGDVQEHQIAIYFSGSTGQNYKGGIDEILAERIVNAKQSVDVAIYGLSLNSITDALIESHLKGVQVRVFGESDNLSWDQFQLLQQAGIPLKGDERSSLMHNKFTIIDGQEVWTGSMNYTAYGVYRNDNNLIQLISEKMAKNYQVEFDELWERDKGRVLATPFPEIQMNDQTKVEVYFSPEDHIEGKIITILKNATSHIRFMMFAFTSVSIAETLISLHQKGIVVQGVFEEEQRSYRKYDLLKEAGLEVRLDGNYFSMHHKVILVDDTTVITGSYNLTEAASSKNDENVLVLHNPEITSTYLQEFQRVWDIAAQ